MTALSEACAAVLRLAERREEIDPPSDRLLRDWSNADPDLIRQTIDDRALTLADRIRVGFAFAHRLALEASEQASATKLEEAIEELSEAYVALARDRRYSAECRAGAADAAIELAKSSKAFRHTRNVARGIRSSLEVDESDMAEVGASMAEVAATVKAFGSARQQLLPIEVDTPEPVDVAERLSRDRRVVSRDDLEQPEYDTTESHLRLLSASLVNFRGSPGELNVDFRNDAKPRTTLLFGDNGSGKSTIVDAIEFALQGRLGRSSVLDSPLSPMAANYAGSRKSSVRVELSDGSTVERHIERSKSGRIVPDTNAVRPGFRIAPVSLKRADIVRFLSTDSLARGTLLFDYFPTTADGLGRRPEERVRELEEEAFLLRVRRQSDARRLAARLATEEDLTDRTTLARVVEEKVTGGVRWNKFTESSGWNSVDPDLTALIASLHASIGRMSTIKKTLRQSDNWLNPVQHKRRMDLIASELDEVGEQLTASFREVASADYVDRLELLVGESGPVSLDVVVHLVNGVVCFPQQIFSEGNLDLLAVLFFVAVAQRAEQHGQAGLLLVDDVFQSVDAGIRLGALEHILKQLSGWQLLFSVHDRLWLEQLRTALRRAQHPFVERHIFGWSFEGGPRLADSGSAVNTAIRAALATREGPLVAAAAGRTLEQICQNLSWRLPISVQRRPDDRYSLGDLWPGTLKQLKKTDASGAALRVDAMSYLRNLLGAHYNEFADSVPLSDALEFGESVDALLHLVWCENCSSWIEGRPLRCRCGACALT